MIVDVEDLGGLGSLGKAGGLVESGAAVIGAAGKEVYEQAKAYLPPGLAKQYIDYESTMAGYSKDIAYTGFDEGAGAAMYVGGTAVATIGATATAGPVGGAVVGIGASLFRNLLFDKPPKAWIPPEDWVGYIAPSLRDRIVIVRAIEYVLDHEGALKKINKSLDTDNEDTEKGRKQLRTSYRNLLKFLRAKGTDGLDQFVGDDNDDFSRFQVMKPPKDIGGAHWLIFSKSKAYNRLFALNSNTSVEGLDIEHFNFSGRGLGTAMIQEALIQFGNAEWGKPETENLIAAQVIVRDAEDDIANRFPQMFARKDLGASWKFGAGKLVNEPMKTSWAGNLRFVFLWQEILYPECVDSPAYGLTKKEQEAASQGKKMHFNLKAKGVDKKGIIAAHGGASAVQEINGKLYGLRPVMVYRAGGDTPKEAMERTGFLEQHGLSQVPGEFSRAMIALEDKTGSAMPDPASGQPVLPAVEQKAITKKYVGKAQVSKSKFQKTKTISQSEGEDESASGSGAVGKNKLVFFAPLKPGKTTIKKVTLVEDPEPSIPLPPKAVQFDVETGAKQIIKVGSAVATEGFNVKPVLVVGGLAVAALAFWFARRK